MECPSLSCRATGISIGTQGAVAAHLKFRLLRLQGRDWSSAKRCKNERPQRGPGASCGPRQYSSLLLSRRVAEVRSRGLRPLHRRLCLAGTAGIGTGRAGIKVAPPGGGAAPIAG